MKGQPEERARELAINIIETGATVRACAAKFGISKSTVHKDVTERLRSVSPMLWSQVMPVLQKNKSERHIRGGEATKQKYKHASV